MTKTAKISAAALVALLSLGSTGAASAQGFFGISFEKHRKGKRFGLSIGLPVGRPHARHHRHDDGCRRWVPGGYECVEEKVWVEGTRERVWVPPVYRTVHSPCGEVRRVLVRQGYYETVRRPGHYETVTRRVRRPGRWEYACGY